MEKDDENGILNDNKPKRPSHIPSHIDHRNTEPGFNYNQFLGIILVVGFLIIGSAAGTYGLLKNLIEAPCLGCLGLYPSYESDFMFDTVDGRPHPEFVLDTLEENSPVFIEFTQNDENCPPCARMRPKVHELVDQYRYNVTFFIINVNEEEITKYFEYKQSTKPTQNEQEAFHVYDMDNIGGGQIATPTYIIITIDEDENGEVRPSFITRYGVFKEENAEKTKKELANILDLAINRYNEYNEDYNA